MRQRIENPMARIHRDLKAQLVLMTQKEKETNPEVTFVACSKKVADYLKNLVGKNKGKL